MSVIVNGMEMPKYCYDCPYCGVMMNIEDRV